VWFDKVDRFTQDLDVASYSTENMMKETKDGKSTPSRVSGGTPRTASRGSWRVSPHTGIKK
jgi:hypothetical protein